jgi:hypothetical protein
MAKGDKMNISELFSFSRAKWQNDIVPFPTELKEIQLIKIMHLGSKRWVELGKQDIDNFLSFMQKGSCNKILKSATRYQIRIQHEQGTSDYFIYDEALGPEQGGLVQAAFEPKKRGFGVFLHSFF